MFDMKRPEIKNMYRLTTVETHSSVQALKKFTEAAKIDPRRLGLQRGTSQLRVRGRGRAWVRQQTLDGTHTTAEPTWGRGMPYTSSLK